MHSSLQKRGMGMKAMENFQQTILAVILLLIAATMVVPFLYVMMISFTDASVYRPGEFYLWPEKWSIEAYKVILTGNGFLNAFKSTMFITLVGTPINLICNAGLAYMLSKGKLPGGNTINKLVMFTMLFTAGIIPNFINMSTLGLMNSWFACILPGACGAWTVMVMKTFFEELPEELEEAAKIDGCGPLRIFGQIVLPLSKAMLATFTLFAFVSYWNCYFNAIMYITDTAKSPLQVYLQKLVLSSNISDVVDLQNPMAKIVPQEVMRMAAVVVVVFPVLCFYPFLQKYFAKGVMVGAVKG